MAHSELYNNLNFSLPAAAIDMQKEEVWAGYGDLPMRQSSESTVQLAKSIRRYWSDWTQVTEQWVKWEELQVQVKYADKLISALSS